ncbi:GntP family permease [Nesterenkonia halotolerans]|uniref:GntP family gluconate:H+ symporter n=1 Tax=Nesterenkonia halotolerans TaxID=225325 RepID=A0ABR9J3F7_9MICC|nr:GntP family permease [Nesterenkonia halotolerans]MBE1513513.1 GntP family gluconate:H+ symporter [Nesterenkonia halotolerans]
MTLEGWEQTLGTGPLLGIAAASIAVLLLLIIRFKVHAFVALILVSLLTAAAAGIPTAQIVPVLTSGFGSTLASVALLVGLGAMLGRIVEVSGGAKVLADALVTRFGEKRAPLALGVASLLFGFPIFFDAGLVVMLPVVFAVGRRLGGSVLIYGLPVAGAFSVMHVFVPPHPGPVAASEFFEANVGILLLVALPIAVLTWYVTSYLFGMWAGRRFELPIPMLLGQADEEAEKNPPRFSTVVLILLLPMLLIFLNTGLDTLSTAGVVSADQTESAWYGLLTTLGATPVALIITLLVAVAAVGTRGGRGMSGAQDVMDKALAPVCAVILITGAGGMFGGVLRESGIGEALSDSLSGMGIPLIVAGFVIAGVLRIAQGSATVALTTAAGLLATGVAAADFNELQLAAMVISVAGGSVIASHVNDSGFWLISRFFDMDVKTTLKTWTVLETLIGVMAFLLAWALFGVASLV